MEKELKIIQVKVKDIIPYKNNAKKHDQVQINNVAESIKQFGFRQPIVLDKDNVIIIGHCRWLASKKLKLDTVPCHYAEDLTEEQVIKLRNLDNKLNESEWDYDLLKDQVINIDFTGFDIDWGIPDIETEPQEVTEDIPPEVDEVNEPICKKGDIWQLGEHRLMCGDSTDKETVAKLMNGEKADMVFTDPPYGVSYTEKNEFLNSIGKPLACVNAIENDSHKPEEMKIFWDKAFANLYEFTKDKMSYYITAPQGGDLLLLLLLLLSVRDAGFALKHQLIWNKNNHVLGRCDYNYKHEPIIYGWKIKGTHNYYGKGEFQTSVSDVEKPLKNDLHPTMKPIRLICNALNNNSLVNDIVLDLFVGSGSTLIACEQLNRKCYAMELDPKYCDVIIKRWENLTNKKAVKL